jgi:hypothetical protein
MRYRLCSAPTKAAPAAGEEAMKKVVSGAAGLVLLGTLALGQEPTAHPNAPKFVKFAKAPGLQINYVDFKWDEAAFQALQQGTTDHPAARRSWVLARLMVQTPVKWQGRTIGVGSALLVLNPARAGTGPTLHIQYVDMREVFVDMNVIAEPPEGRIYGTVPADFVKADTLAPRLVVSLNQNGDNF